MTAKGSWWDLPGPHSFVMDVLDALEEGCSVILGLPPNAPAGLHDNLIADLDARGTLYWHTVDIAGSKKIAQLLADDLIPLARRAPRSFADEIVSDIGLRTTVIYLTGIDDHDRFREFAAFFAQYLDCVRKTKSKRAIPRLIFDLPYTLLRDPRIEADSSTVRMLEWTGRVGPSDMHLYVGTRMPGRHGPGPTNLFERIVVEFAGWDPKLAEELSQWSDSDLLNPKERLQELAIDWGRTTLAWQDGTQDLLGGRRLSHILYHIVVRDYEEINKRLWRAHVSEVFPWLEELRVHLIDQFRDSIRLPHVLQTDDIIEEATLLEIGQLYWNLKNLARLPDSSLALVDLCRRARNDLAHRRPVATHRLQRLEQEWKHLEKVW
jgi:hypothetical protein